MIWLKRFAIAISFLIAQQASAAIVYDNGGPASPNDAAPLDGLISVGGVNGLYAVVDDFTLAHKTVLTDAHFWTIEAQDTNISNWNGNLTYTILADASGMPGAVLGTGTYEPGSLTRTATAVANTVTLGAFNADANRVAWDFDFSEPLKLGSGRYWFSLILGTVNDLPTASKELFWEATASAPASNSTAKLRIPGSDIGTNVDLAFYLTGNPIPTPGIILLMLSGLLGLSFFRKKRSA